MINKLFSTDLKVINMGLRDFSKNLSEAGCKKVIDLDWRPPAGGNKKMLKILSELKKFA
ncbi:fdrA domain protein [bacterium]|nr:fdrA domain protein [bacterium]